MNSAVHPVFDTALFISIHLSSWVFGFGKAQNLSPPYKLLRYRLCTSLKHSTLTESSTGLLCLVTFATEGLDSGRRSRSLGFLPFCMYICDVTSPPPPTRLTRKVFAIQASKGVSANQGGAKKGVSRPTCSR